MKLKGTYSGETTYDVGDVVAYSDGNIYHLQKPCKAGTPPVETLYWGRVSQPLSEAIHMVLDAMEIEDTALGTVAASIPTNLNDSALVLKSSTASSDKEFIITVDDDGELTATEIEEEEESDT